MGTITKEDLDRLAEIRARSVKPVADVLPSMPAVKPRERDVAPQQESAAQTMLGVAGTGFRYLDRAARVIGLGIGTAAAANPLTAFYHFIPGIKDWLPDVERVPDAIKAFDEMRRKGDWDGAIEAYQDELDAGPGYWGAAEVAATFVPTGGPALAGAKLMSAAPKLAGTLARIAPVTPRTAVQVRRGLQPVIRGTGKTLRLPWEAEEAVGRLAVKGLGWAAAPIRQQVAKQFRVDPFDLQTPKQILEAEDILGPRPTAPTGARDLAPRRAPTIDLVNVATDESIELPAVYLRFGDLPRGDTPSFNWFAQRPEKGVSVYKAWHDPKTGKYVLKQETQDRGAQQVLINQIQDGEEGLKIFEVEGEHLGLTGWDFEDLLTPGSARVVREVPPSRIVVDDDPRVLITGDELDPGQIPDWTTLEALATRIPPPPRRPSSWRRDPVTESMVPVPPEELKEATRLWREAMEQRQLAPTTAPTGALDEPVAAGARVTAGGKKPPNTPVETPQVTAGGAEPTVISADIREGFGADPRLSRWGSYVNRFNDVLEKLPGRPRIKPKKEPGLYEQVASAVKARTDVERQMVGHGSALRAYIRQGKKVFGAFDKNGRITDPKFSNRAHDTIGDEIYILTQPTIQDVAARMDTYRPFMTDEQLKFMESLRDIFENGTSWTKGGVTRKMPGWNAILRKELPGWKPSRVRPDIEAGGFYLSRGRAKPPGRFSQMGDNELLESFTARKPRKLDKLIIAQNRARSPSMGNAINNGVVYDTFEDAMVIHINDVGKKLADINLGKTIGTINRNIPEKLGRKRVGVTTAKSLAEQLKLGRIPTIGKETIIDDELIAAITKQLKEPWARKIASFPLLKQVNDVYRGFKATYDFSALGIHGAFAAFRDPVMWKDAAKISLGAFMRRDSIRVADDMIRGADEAAMAKGLLTSDFWSTAGLRIAAGGTEYAIPFMSRLAQGRVPVVKQAAQLFERTNLSFGVFGDALRLDWANKLLEAELRRGQTLKELWTINPATGRSQAHEMASIANKLTGWTEKRFGGDIGEVLLFAPKYFQSRLESYGQALAGIARYAGTPLGVKQTIQGREAARTIAQTVFFGASLTEIINGALGNETDRRPWVDGRPNPNFYVISYGGRDFSLFGPSVGFFQAIANTATGNAGRAMRSLGSGWSRLVWDNLWSGYTFTGEEAFFTRDELGRTVITNPLRAIAYLAELVTPIAPGQAGEQLVDVVQQLPGAVEQLRGIEPEEERVGPSPIERVIGGTVAVTAETIGGRVSPQSRSDWQNMIAKEQFGMDYDDLDNIVKPVIDKLVLQEYGEQVYRGPKGRLYRERDEINATFLDQVQDTTTSWLSGGPNSEEYSPPNARSEYQSAAAARIGAQYGTQYRPDKGRTVGGVYEYLYDRDEEREEPKPGKPGTKERKEYLLWQYYNLIPNATDGKGTVDWEEYNKASSEFWSSLSYEEVGMMLANIRVIEGEMPKEMQTLLDAGRYAQAVRVTVDGRSVSFWDIEDLPEVRDSIALEAGATRAQVDTYLDAMVKRRDYLKINNDIYAEIGSALGKARDLDEGILGQKRWDFMKDAPKTWMLAMIAAGYYLPKKVELGIELKKAGEYSTITEQPYDSLYRDALAGR